MKTSPNFQNNLKSVFISGTLIFLSCLFSLSNESPFGGKTVGLYSEADQVYSLTVNTIYDEVFSSPKAWLVEFYSSWCGHCVSYAPKWKQFAEDLKSWNTVVVIAAIDCADETNIPACRAFDILGYPTLRLFPLQAPRMVSDPEGKANMTLNTGDVMKRPASMTQLKNNLIDSLIPMFPKILAPMDNNRPFSEAIEIWRDSEFQTGPDFLLIIFERNGSFVGPEVALRLSSFQDKIRVLRFFQKNRLYENIGLDGWPAAGYVTRDSDSGQIVLGNNQDLIDLLVKEATRLAKLESTKDDSEIEKPVEKVKNDEGKISGDIGKEETNAEEINDKVSMEDLLHTIRNALRNEVSLHRRLDGAKLIALRNFVTILSQYFPSDRREVRVFLGKLSDWIRPQRQIETSVFLDKLDGLESSFHPWDIDLNSWVDCKSTITGRRGYTCGLWRLFHTLTVVALEKHEDADVLPAIIGYVKNFFGCQECTIHFQGMVDRDKALEIRSIQEQTEWLWKAHNEINLRLKGTPSEDPAYPKGLYPNKKNCRNCYSSAKDFDAEKVEEYLLKVYSNPARLAQHPPAARLVMGENDGVLDGKAKNTLLGGLFNLTDIGIFMIVYLSIALLLVFGYLHFRGVTKRRTISASCLRRVCSKTSV